MDFVTGLPIFYELEGHQLRLDPRYRRPADEDGTLRAVVGAGMRERYENAAMCHGFGLMLGMSGLRSTQSSDLHDRQIYTNVRLVTQVRGHRRSDKSRLAVSLIYGVWLFSWF